MNKLYKLYSNQFGELVIEQVSIIKITKSFYYINDTYRNRIKICDLEHKLKDGYIFSKDRRYLEDIIEKSYLQMIKGEEK